MIALCQTCWCVVSLAFGIESFVCVVMEDNFAVVVVVELAFVAYFALGCFKRFQ